MATLIQIPSFACGLSKNGNSSFPSLVARIGETLDQVLKHYGRCLKTLTAENGMVYNLFSKRGLKILVHFYENKVDEISYGKDTDIFDGLWGAVG